METKAINAELFFKTVNTMIDEARAVGDKTVVLLEQNRVAFSLIFGLGLRTRELLSLDLDSIVRDGGDGGRTLLRIRRTKGGPNREYVVPVPGDTLPALLEHYIEEVRPALVRNPAERALFLSGRGGRLEYAVLAAAFKQVVLQSEFDANGCLRNLRYSGISVLARYLPLDYLKYVCGGTPLTSVNTLRHLISMTRHIDVLAGAMVGKGGVHRLGCFQNYPATTQCYRHDMMPRPEEEGERQGE